MSAAAGEILYAARDVEGVPLVLERLLEVIRYVGAWPARAGSASHPYSAARHEHALQEVLDSNAMFGATVPIAKGLAACEGMHLMALLAMADTFGALLCHPNDPLIQLCFKPIRPILAAWQKHLNDMAWSKMAFIRGTGCADPAAVGAWVQTLPWDVVLVEAERRDRAAAAVIAGWALADFVTESIRVTSPVREAAHVS